MAERLKKNQLYHLENQKIFTGWKNGDWWENGVCNPRRKLAKIVGVRGLNLNGTPKVLQPARSA